MLFEPTLAMNKCCLFWLRPCWIRTLKWGQRSLLLFWEKMCALFLSLFFDNKNSSTHCLLYSRDEHSSNEEYRRHHNRRQRNDEAIQKRRSSSEKQRKTWWIVERYKLYANLLLEAMYPSSLRRPSVIGEGNVCPKKFSACKKSSMKQTKLRKSHKRLKYQFMKKYYTKLAGLGTG